MRRLFALPVAALALGAAALAGCGYGRAIHDRGPVYDRGPYGNDPYYDDGYGGYGTRRVATLPGGERVYRDNGRLLVEDRYGRRYDYGRGRAAVCHRGRTLAVSDRAIDGHVRHGDRFGGCTYDRRYGYGGYDGPYGGTYDRPVYGTPYPVYPRTTGREAPVDGRARGATTGRPEANGRGTDGTVNRGTGRTGSVDAPRGARQTEPRPAEAPRTQRAPSEPQGRVSNGRSSGSSDPGHASGSTSSGGRGSTEGRGEARGSRGGN